MNNILTSINASSHFLKFKNTFCRFGVKVGIAASAVYYLSEQGVWKDSDEANKVYGKLNEVASPYVKQVTAQVPIEIPELPSRNQVSYVAKQYWNKGVICSFEFLSNVPETVDQWTQKGLEAARKNPDINNFLNSFSSSPQTTVEKK